MQRSRSARWVARRRDGVLGLGLVLVSCGRISLGSLDDERDRSFSRVPVNAAVISNATRQPPRAPAPSLMIGEGETSIRASLDAGDPPLPSAGDDGLDSGVPLPPERDPDATVVNATDAAVNAPSDAAVIPPSDAGAAQAFSRLAPSCQRARPLCGDEDAPSSCCDSRAVPGGSFALRVATNRVIPASVSSFRLDRFEVTVARMREFVASYDAWRASGQPALDVGENPAIPGTGWQERFTPGLPASAAELESSLRACEDVPFSTYASSVSDASPVNCVTWYEAAAFCAWDGGRLPTFSELTYAGAGGDENRLYPWGDQPVPRRELALFGCRIDVDFPICTIDDLSAVGQRALGAGLFGQDDLAGSLSEWVFDTAPEFGEDCVDCVSSGAEQFRVWRGGGWLDAAPQMQNDYFAAIGPDARHLSVGFRCARNH